jgi:uncharacterized MAPEG superfamily protein
MTLDLQVLAWTIVLAIVQILLPAAARTRQYGVKWNAGPRDREMPQPGPLVGRLARAQANLFETLPLIIGAVLIAHVGGADPQRTALGAEVYLGARIVYLPLYAFGVPYLRSLAWVACLVGLIIVLSGVFTA